MLVRNETFPDFTELTVTIIDNQSPLLCHSSIWNNSAEQKKSFRELMNS